MPTPRSLTLVGAVLVAISGCTGSPPRTSATGTPGSNPSTPAASSSSARITAGADCAPTYRAGGHPVFFGPAGRQLAGYTFGAGRTGIVFAHESDDDSCDWFPYAQDAAKHGYRTLAFDFEGYGASPPSGGDQRSDVASAAGYLRAQGATRIVLVGASMGGTAVINAAPTIGSALTAVVALSSPRSYNQSPDATVAAAKIKAPLLMICGALDTTFVADVQAIYRAATASAHRQILLANSSLHGFRLVTPAGGYDAEARRTLAAFLARYAPA